ncbi:MAG: PEP-CTERM sorting domain-containing protein [Acidobacteriia bacterium]|nr:PEP-CTERM sorting domain-containing protein [Terriglobia bacterium]
MRAPLLVLTLVLAALSTQFAAADTIKFTYSGVDINGVGAITSGSGYFSFRHGLRTVTLSDLYNFRFSQSTLHFDGNLRSTFVYRLANLIDFSAVITGSRFTSSLSLDTVATPGTNPIFLPESFHIISLARNDAYTANAFGDILTVGDARLTPEPTSIILVATGFLGIVSRIRKSRSPRDQKPPNVAVL